jgi:hypothetical protein
MNKLCGQNAQLLVVKAGVIYNYQSAFKGYNAYGGTRCTGSTTRCVSTSKFHGFRLIVCIITTFTVPS